MSSVGAPLAIMKAAGRIIMSFEICILLEGVVDDVVRYGL